MATELLQSLQKFCETNQIRRLDADEIRELLADGEDPDWVAAQAAEDRPELIAQLTALLEELAPQLRPAEVEGVQDEGQVIEVQPEPAAESGVGDLQAQLAAMGETLPPGVDAQQLQQVLSSPRGQLMADFGAFCQDRGDETPDEELLQVYHEEWLQTPRASLGGKRPAEMLEGGRLLPEKVTTFRREQPKVGRNDPCPCGSGKKYKRCCGKGGGG